MAKVGSGSIVTALTAAALAVIGVLAWQADAAPHGAAKPSAGTGTGTGHSAPPPRPAPSNTALAPPAHSGTGERVVYAPARHRVWLIGTDGRTARTFEVAPGTVTPQAGTYAVTFRKSGLTGTDGVPVKDIVYFAVTGGTQVAFDYAANGSLPTPDPARKTGGIREKAADGAAMWQFAIKGTKVIVVP